MEEILNQSGAAIRHLRCGSFLENLQWQAQPVVEHGLLALPIPGHISLPIVAMSDIADTALRWLLRCEWRGIERIAVHGRRRSLRMSAIGDNAGER